MDTPKLTAASLDTLQRHPGIAWAYRLAELEGYPGNGLMVYAYTRIWQGNQHIPETRRTPEAIAAAERETAAMKDRAKQLTAEMDEAGLLDWRLCNEN